MHGYPLAAPAALVWAWRQLTQVPCAQCFFNLRMCYTLFVSSAITLAVFL